MKNTGGQACVDGVCVAVADAGHSDGGFVGDAGPACQDRDFDRHFAMTATCPAGDDCDDSNPAVHPDQPELCGDSIDNNCMMGVDEPSCGCDIGQTVTWHQRTRHLPSWSRRLHGRRHARRVSR